MADEGDALCHTGRRAEGIGGGVFDVVEESVDGAGGDMQTGIRRGVIDKDGAIGFGDPAIAEDDIGNIPDPFGTLGCDEIAAGFCKDAGGIFEIGKEEVEDIAQACCGVADAMREVEPAFRSLQWGGALSVFQFADGVVKAAVDDGFRAGDSDFHGVAEGPADASSRAGVDESILGPGVESVFPVHKFGVEDHVALLCGGGSQIREAFPFAQIPGADDAALGDRAGLVGLGSRGIAAFGAEQAVNPTVLMAHEAHVVNIGIRVVGFRDDARLVVETEAVNTRGGLRDAEEALAIPSLDTRAEGDAAIPFDGTGIHDRIDAKPLHEKGIPLFIEVIAPFERHMRGSQNRIGIPFINSVITIRIDGVRLCQEGSLSLAEKSDPLGEGEGIHTKWKEMEMRIEAEGFPPVESAIKRAFQ